MFTVIIGEYKIECKFPGLPLQDVPEIYKSYKDTAKLAEEFDLDGTGGDLAFFSVKHQCIHKLTVAWRADPGEVAAFFPDALIIPETNILFLGGGNITFAYDLNVPVRV